MGEERERERERESERANKSWRFIEEECCGDRVPAS